jgi:uncharacterized repeat protein (TIGR03803 family)
MSRIERLVIVPSLLLIFSAVLSAQTFTTIAQLGRSYPHGSLLQGVDGNLYGVTADGETIYRVSPGGTLTTVYEFCNGTCATGSRPVGIMQTRDGNLWGTTLEGGPHGNGNVFRISPQFVGTDVVDLTPHSGEGPLSGLILATDGNFYGAANEGGNIIGCDTSDGGCGTVYKVTPAGRLSPIYAFCPLAGCADGWGPVGTLVQASDGNLYGTAELGGVAGCLLGLGCGTVFKVTLGGTFTTLHEFVDTDGGNPWEVGGLI